MRFDLSRELAVETLGTGFLVSTVVGSGIMADGLTDHGALALLGNTISTPAILVVLITMLGSVSGVHSTPRSRSPSRPAAGSGAAMRWPMPRRSLLGSVGRA